MQDRLNAFKPLQNEMRMLFLDEVIEDGRKFRKSKYLIAQFHLMIGRTDCSNCDEHQLISTLSHIPVWVADSRSEGGLFCLFDFFQVCFVHLNCIDQI